MNPTMISAVCGISGFGSPCSSSAASRKSVFIADALEDEREHQTEERERLGQGEPEERDGLEQASRLRLAGDAVDVRGEDETHADAGADGRQAVAHEVEGALHYVLPFGCQRKRWLGQCSSARAPAMYRA